MGEIHGDDGAIEQAAPAWGVFGDLMSGLLGAFVLILVGVLGVQLELATTLEAEVQKRRVEQQRREALEKALAVPLASGRVTLNDGRIGISGSVLFALNSALHSYLIVSYAREDGVSLDVGFYYMANAAGRLLGTVLSGWVYQVAGLEACLWISAAFVAIAAAVSLALPRHAQPA